MDKILKDKKILGAIAAVVLIIVAVGAYFVFSKNSSNTAGSGQEEEQILTMSPDEIGLSIVMSDDGKKVIMRVDKVEGIKSLEYQLSYTSEGDIPRGAIGNVEVTGEPIEKEIVLGTCSDVCHYDENVKDVKIIVKVTKEDGKVYQVEKGLDK